MSWLGCGLMLRCEKRSLVLMGDVFVWAILGCRMWWGTRCLFEICSGECAVNVR